MVQAQPSMVLSNSPVTSGPVAYFIRPALTVGKFRKTFPNMKFIMTFPNMKFIIKPKI
jgi:hypothetical protein